MNFHVACTLKSTRNDDRLTSLPLTQDRSNRLDGRRVTSVELFFVMYFISSPTFRTSLFRTLAKFSFGTTIKLNRTRVIEINASSRNDCAFAQLPYLARYRERVALSL